VGGWRGGWWFWGFCWVGLVVEGVGGGLGVAVCVFWGICGLELACWLLGGLCALGGRGGFGSWCLVGCGCIVVTVVVLVGGWLGGWCGA